MLNLVSLSTQSLASCVNYFVWNCFTCFSNTKIGSVTSFSILFNFQGPVRLSLSADDLTILPQKRFFVKLFFRNLLNFLNLDCFVFLGANRELVGVRPLHLAFARPLCLLERPTGAIHCFRNRKTFQRLLVLFKGFRLRFQKSFFCLSAWRSSIIPHPGALVNTFWQVFEEKFEFSSFLSFAADFGSKKGPPALLHRRSFFLYYLYSRA